MNDARHKAARDELLRLLKGLEFYRAWRISGLKAAKGEVRQEDLDQIVEPGAVFLEHFDTAGSRSNQILQFVREWYSHTYAELCFLAQTGGEAVSSDVRKFLTDSQNEIGFEFQSEAGLVAKTVSKALQSGKITKERDYYILNELENAGSQPLLSGRDLDAVSDMLRQFENRRKQL